MAYWFGKEFFASRRKSFLLALLVMSTYPMLRYGLNPIVETGVWALYYGTLAAILTWSKTLQTRWLWIASLCLLGGVLWKEYIVLAGLIFGFTILLQPTLSLKGKLHAIVQGVCLIVLPWAIWQWHVYDVWNYSYVDWLITGTGGDEHGLTYNFVSVTKSIFMLLALGWLFVALSWFKREELSRDSWRFWFIMLVPSFGFLLWGYVSSRLFSSLIPLMAPLAVLGLSIIPNFYVRVLVVVCIGIINLGLVWAGYQPDIRELITALTYGSA
jgi:hypothetical protein